MQLLTTEAEIRAAIAMLNPIARTAAQSLANYLLENPHLLNDKDGLNKAFTEHCMFAMKQSGWDLSNTDRIDKFFEDHSEAIGNLCISIVNFSICQAQRQRKWGWLGKAAAATAGFIIGSLFG